VLSQATRLAADGRVAGGAGRFRVGVWFPHAAGTWTPRGVRVRREELVSAIQRPLFCPHSWHLPDSVPILVSMLAGMAADDPCGSLARRVILDGLDPEPSHLTPSNVCVAST